MLRVLAGGSDPVVTTGAGATDFVVVGAGNRCPASGAVARFTNVAGLNVSWVFAGGADAVVAGKTVAADVVVIDAG